jgi:hypothetical protein
VGMRRRTAGRRRGILITAYPTDAIKKALRYGRCEVFYDREGKTLAVWFTERSRESICKETGAEVVLMKDAAGRVIGFEKLNFSIPHSDSLQVALETVPA